MRTTTGMLSLALALLAGAPVARANDAAGYKGVEKIGLNSIWIKDFDTTKKYKDEHGGQDELDYTLDLFVSAGAHVCRVDVFELSGSGYKDWRSSARGRLSGRTWAESADAVLAALAKRHIKPYALLNLDLAKGDEPSYDFLHDETTDPERAVAFVHRFAVACEEVVGRYRNRIPVFEIVNEPNNHGIVDPAWQALILQKVYDHAKWAHGWDTTIVTGPIFSGGATGSAADWMLKLYAAGMHYMDASGKLVKDPDWAKHHPALAGLDWDAFRHRTGTLPYDGIGYHAYVLTNYWKVEPTATTPGTPNGPGDVQGAFDGYMDAIEKVVARFDHDAARKKFWISEFGWHATVGTKATEGLTKEQARARQRDMIVAACRALIAEDRVAAVLYFCVQDFQDKDKNGKVVWETYGLVAGHDGEGERPAFDAFKIVEGRLPDPGTGSGSGSGSGGGSGTGPTTNTTTTPTSIGFSGVFDRSTSGSSAVNPAQPASPGSGASPLGSPASGAGPDASGPGAGTPITNQPLGGP